MRLSRMPTISSLVDYRLPLEDLWQSELAIQWVSLTRPC